MYSGKPVAMYSGNLWLHSRKPPASFHAAPQDFRRARPDGITTDRLPHGLRLFSRSPSGSPGREQRLFRKQVSPTHPNEI